MRAAGALTLRMPRAFLQPRSLPPARGLRRVPALRDRGDTSHPPGDHPRRAELRTAAAPTGRRWPRALPTAPSRRPPVTPRRSPPGGCPRGDVRECAWGLCGAEHPAPTLPASCSLAPGASPAGGCWAPGGG